MFLKTGLTESEKKKTFNNLFRFVYNALVILSIHLLPYYYY